jgi:hypothetical protein
VKQLTALERRVQKLDAQISQANDNLRSLYAQRRSLKEQVGKLQVVCIEPPAPKGDALPTRWGTPRLATAGITHVNQLAWCVANPYLAIRVRNIGRKSLMVMRSLAEELGIPILDSWWRRTCP